MKTLILIATAGLLAFNLQAGEGKVHTDASAKTVHGDKYCAKMKDGKLTVMHEGNVLAADASLSNGGTVRTDGTIVKKDGSTVTLKEGECVDKDGKIMKETKKEKSKMPDK
jgi:hypothetical protein